MSLKYFTPDIFEVFREMAVGFDFNDLVDALPDSVDNDAKVNTAQAGAIAAVAHKLLPTNYE